MPQVVHRSQDEDIPPLSFSGAWRSVALQLEVYKERPANLAFLLALCTWLAAGYRLCCGLSSADLTGICLDAKTLYFRGDLSRWLLHIFWPLEPGIIRGFLSSTLLLVFGYALEFELGTGHFLALLLGIQLGSAFILLHFGFAGCVVSFEPAFAGLAAVMHKVNPKVHSDGMGSALKLPWEVEPRWHVWVLLSFLLLQAQDFPKAFLSQIAGLVVGTLCVLREPEVWSDTFRSVARRSFSSGSAAHVVLFVFTILFMPLTVPEAPPEIWASLQAALTDGRALSPSWWSRSIPSSLPLVHMAMNQQLSPEALYISKVLLSFALPLLLSSLEMWVKGYSIFLVILLMYSMNSPVWRYPHWGFIFLAYLAVAFWKLPAAAEKRKSA
ncbi:Uncharacterized protein SCF082_LOCUS23752 [Durusdinium trenchii]|uniref:GPI mannosyltransferase 2 n=1 Tax=Durusdinium trenchii TaxID=1381693 RepID=A0ABP0LR22_9DINO